MSPAKHDDHEFRLLELTEPETCKRAAEALGLTLTDESLHNTQDNLSLLLTHCKIVRSWQNAE